MSQPGGALFWAGLVVGWAIMGYGVWLVLDQPDLTPPLPLARYVLSSAVVHDLVLAPLVVVVGLATARLLPARARGPVQGGLALSGIVVLFAYPLLRGFGRRPLNPSALPLDYHRNVALILAGIWLVALCTVAVRRLRGRP